MWGEDPRMYEIAKRVTHSAGLDWYDPRDGKRYKVPRTKAAQKARKERGHASSRSTSHARKRHYNPPKRRMK
jgi:hypothetical protein